MDRWIWEPSPEWIERTNVYRFMQRLGIRDRQEFIRWSSEHLEEFWREMAVEAGTRWLQPYNQVLDTSQGVEWSRWFTGGKLNIADNCLDRYKDSKQVAILWEGEDRPPREIKFSELYSEVNRLANALRSMGLREGDRVALCMPMVPEIVTILYACFKLGLIVVPIFAGFGAGAIATRLENSGARVIFTADQLHRRGKPIPLRAKVEQAAERARSVEKILTLENWAELLRGQSSECETLPLDSEARSLILYTSGTTGKPKGTVHTHAGALAQMSKEIYLAFDHQPADRFFWLSDIGWMMGPWTIIGNHHFGGTILLYDGAPDYPDPGRLWQIIERHGITTFGISPTAIRLLMRSDSAKSHAMPSLRLLGSTGEPWDETSYAWYFENVGKCRCPIINISGGTEIVGCFLFPLPIQPLKPCTLGAPAPGMATEVVDDAGHPVRGKMGYLVCTKPAPSMTRGVWGDPDRYLETYWSRWPGVWFHGDWASVDEDGCWFLHGRADESMNVAGRKVGPAEVEDALMEHSAVAEAAVIGVPDEIKGETIVGFVVLKKDFEPSESLRAAVAKHVVDSLGPTFRPHAIQFVLALPKTQSGKVVRRLIRQRYLGEEIGDTSTVENPAALEAFRPGAIH
ncbi:MAG TPA: AMP-binding protein [Bryobacteraceae bacterium]|nr:AMP-binding protein [Bryobacteraceae bacterium]